MKNCEITKNRRVGAVDRATLCGALTICALLTEGNSAAHASETDKLSATIRRTEFGVPHVTASNWRNLGFGLGYANAEDRVCDMAEVYVTARAERSFYWGAEGGNLESDLYRQRLIDSGVPMTLVSLGSSGRTSAMRSRSVRSTNTASTSARSK